MAYVPLSLMCSNTKVAAGISIATERHLKEAHYLMASTYSRDSPDDHFGHSATVMTLLAVVAASAIRNFSPKRNKNAKGDRVSFVSCVEQYFPWDHVTVADDQHRRIDEQRRAAAEELYAGFRNPLVRSGGVVGKGHRICKVVHSLPGFASFQENEAIVSSLCNRSTLHGQRLLEMTAAFSAVHTQPLYWCSRKMIEAFAADPIVQTDVAVSLAI